MATLKNPTKNPASWATSGRFRKGVRYPEREGTYFKGFSYNGYPSKEAYLKAMEAKKEQKEKEAQAVARNEKIQTEIKDIQDIAREMSENSMRVLDEIQNNPDATDSARILAATTIIDRAYGKPTVTSMNLNLNQGVNPSEINAVELDTRIAEALSRIERLTNREAKAPESEVRPPNLRFNH